MIWGTSLALGEFEFPFSGSLVSIFSDPKEKERAREIRESKLRQLTGMHLSTRDL